MFGRNETIYQLLGKSIVGLKVEDLKALKSKMQKKFEKEYVVLSKKKNEAAIQKLEEEYQTKLAEINRAILHLKIPRPPKLK